MPAYIIVVLHVLFSSSLIIYGHTNNYNVIPTPDLMGFPDCVSQGTDVTFIWDIHAPRDIPKFAHAQFVFSHDDKNIAFWVINSMSFVQHENSSSKEGRLRFEWPKHKKIGFTLIDVRKDDDGYYRCSYFRENRKALISPGIRLYVKENNITNCTETTGSAYESTEAYLGHVETHTSEYYSDRAVQGDMSTETHLGSFASNQSLFIYKITTFCALSAIALAVIVAGCGICIRGHRKRTPIAPDPVPVVDTYMTAAGNTLPTDTYRGARTQPVYVNRASSHDVYSDLDESVMIRVTDVYASIVISESTCEDDRKRTVARKLPSVPEECSNKTSESVM